MVKASISVTVFEADDPELYAWIQSLPVGKQRRRSLIIERLRGVVSSDTTPLPPREPPKPKIVEPTKPQPRSDATQKNQPNQTPSDEPVVLHADDLDEIFGPS